MTHDWQPLSVEQTARVFARFPARWWIAGARALDLYVGRELRPHGDTDVLVLRDDQELVRRHLAGWDVQIAHAGRFEPWLQNSWIELPRHGLWARRNFDGPWELQLLLGESDDGEWWYRRDARVRVALDEVGAQTADGIPYVRPEIILLFKSAHPEAKDEADFEAVLPELDAESRRRLVCWLPSGHPWASRLGRPNP